ncbi:MAG: GDSL-type esterase/lipase family protein [Planctomycetota bacterium]|nr:GDSL-type esterase/lipase family protein [Planctomycetota bacterium]
MFVLVAVFLGLTSNSYSRDDKPKFIWSVADSKTDIAPGIVYFRKSFKTPNAESTTLEITCDDGYRVYVNGKLVGRNTAWQTVARYDIQSLLGEQENVIAVHAENASKSPAGLYAKITWKSGKTTQSLGTNRSWKFSKSPKAGWRFPKYDDSGWSDSFEQGEFGKVLPWANRFTYESKPPVSPAPQKTKLARNAFELVNGDRIVFVGSTFIERLQSNDYLETLITSQFSHLDLKFRNLGWSGDNVFGLSRAVFGNQADGFRRLENDLLVADPTLTIVCYGLNESFRGKEYLPTFLAGLEQLVTLLRSNQSDILFISPMLMENLGPPLPDPRTQNQNIKMYTAAIRKYASANGCGFIDNLKPLGSTGFSKTDVPAIRDRLTENGMHLTEYGHWRMAPQLTNKLGGSSANCQFEIDLQHNLFSAVGSTIHSISFENALVKFSAKDDRLLESPPPKFKPRGGKMMATHDQIKISGLQPGNYGLQINGKPSSVANEKQWAAGVLINRSYYVDQPEKLRAMILKKNEMFFHRYRPQNETYLYLFRKHEQGNNAVEIPQFDPIIAEFEKTISSLKKPEVIHYQLQRITSSQ